MTEYKIHGKTISHPGECGLYKSSMGGLKTDYAVMEPGMLVAAINKMSIDDATKQMECLQDMAAHQMEMQETPQNGVPPILMYSGPGPAPIEEVRDNIENTRRFCSDILMVLYNQ